jgi:hypothetical protein
MLQFTEQQAAAGLGSRWSTTHTSAATRREACSPENGLSNLPREFLGRQSSGIDLEHAVPDRPGRRQNLAIARFEIRELIDLTALQVEANQVQAN